MLENPEADISKNHLQKFKSSYFFPEEDGRRFVLFILFFFYFFFSFLLRICKTSGEVLFGSKVKVLVSFKK